jgi:hypothetical protein
MNDDEGILRWIGAARLNRVDEDPGDASARDRDSAMSERKQRDKGQKRDERGGRQKDPVAAVGLKVNLVAISSSETLTAGRRGSAAAAA